MEGPPLEPGEDITWPNQVAPGAERRLVPTKSNLKPQTHDGIRARLMEGDRSYENNEYLYDDDLIIVPEARVDSCLQWAHLSSGHTGCNRSVEFFRESFSSRLVCVELFGRMQPIVASCGRRASKKRDSRDRGLVSTLPIPYCAHSLLYVDFIPRLPKRGGCDSCLFFSFFFFTKSFALRHLSIGRLAHHTKGDPHPRVIG